MARPDASGAIRPREHLLLGQHCNFRATGRSDGVFCEAKANLRLHNELQRSRILPAGNVGADALREINVSASRLGPGPRKSPRRRRLSGVAEYQRRAGETCRSGTAVMRPRGAPRSTAFLPGTASDVPRLSCRFRPQNPHERRNACVVSCGPRRRALRSGTRRKLRPRATT